MPAEFTMQLPAQALFGAGVRGQIVFVRFSRRGHFANARRNTFARFALRIDPRVVHVVLGVEHHRNHILLLESQKNFVLISAVRMLILNLGLLSLVWWWALVSPKS